MSFELSNVEMLIMGHWLQLSVAGVAIFYAIAESYREWQARKSPKMAMYGQKAIGSPSIQTLKAA